MSSNLVVPATISLEENIMPNCLVDKYTKEELEIIVNNSFSMKELLRNLGYGTTSGKNGQTVQKD